MSTKYSVEFDVFTVRHYIKKFEKKYSKEKWKFTEEALRNLCIKFEELQKLEQCDIIKKVDDQLLCKLDFAVAGTQLAPKTAGNRCILVVDTKNIFKVTILLVYHKNNLIGRGSETVEWKKLISTNFPQYRHLL